MPGRVSGTGVAHGERRRRLQGKGGPVDPSVAGGKESRGNIVSL